MSVRTAATLAPASAKKARGPDPERSRGDATLVGEDLRVGQPRVVVERVVEEGVATTMSLAPLAELATEHPVPATVGDAPELLDVEVDQLARMGRLIADGRCSAHREPRGLIEIREQGHPIASQDPPDRRVRQAQVVTDAMRAPAAGVAQGHDPPPDPPCESRRRVPRS